MESKIFYKYNGIDLLEEMYIREIYNLTTQKISMALYTSFFDRIDNFIIKDRSIPDAFWFKETSQKLARTTEKEIEIILLYPYDANLGEQQIPYSHAVLSYGLSEMWYSPKCYRFDKYKHNDNLINNIREDIYKFKIFAIGWCFDHLPHIREFVSKLKIIDPEYRFIIWGGQRTIDPQATQYMLSSGVDAVNPGQAQPFFDAMKNIQHEKHVTRDIVFNHVKDLLATTQQPNVPWGKFPKFEQFPLMWWKSRDPEKWPNQINIPHYLNCPNNCHFCAQIKVGCPNLIESILRRFDNVKSKIHTVRFEGPTFEEPLVWSFRQIMKKIEDKQWFTPETEIIMDSKQFQKRHYDETLSLLKEFNAKYVHIGLNAIDHATAVAVGRNNHGKARTEQEIHEEISGILQFGKESEIPEIKLDMLLTPFDTEETLQKIIDLYKKILCIQKDTWKNIRMYLAPLVPYPGTALYKRHEDKIDFHNYAQLGSQINYDPSIRRYDEKLFGTKFLRKFQAPFMTAHTKILFQDDEAKENYLKFLALSMTFQYLQWKQSLDEMDILFPEYKDSQMVKAIFDAVKTQSIDLRNIPWQAEYFRQNPAKFSFPQIQFENNGWKKSAEAE